jgi:hypothetical protein
VEPIVYQSAIVAAWSLSSSQSHQGFAPLDTTGGLCQGLIY